jgi:hypothetical protein
VDGRSRTGQVVDLIDFNVQRDANIMPDQFKKRIIEKRDDIFLGAGEKIIYAKDIMSFAQQFFTQVGAEKTGPACD